jgi:WD40 repeat protein
MSGDERLAISASWTTTLRVWEVASGRELRTLQGHAAPVRGVTMK